MKKILLLISIAFIFAGCESNQSIVSNVQEREANEIVVFLASKGIAAQKVLVTAEGAAAGTATAAMWNIFVDKNKAVEAMALLNSNGLPKLRGTTLLELFKKSGLMTSDKEETIRYQAGIEEELENTIRKIDGVLDADVKISFPTSSEATLAGTEQSQKIKAAVYVKHQGVLDDPNQHLESKIKRLVAGSVDLVSYEDVSIISDKSRFTDIQMGFDSKLIGPKTLQREYVKIWSIIMPRTSANKFRAIFFTMIFIILGFGSVIGWMIYKFYPQLQKKSKKTK